MDVLKQRLAVEGAISVAQYMAEALGHPRYGYYATRDPLGSTGDFTTAPEISQMFGELIGAWLADTWTALGRPSPVNLVELGPGRGTLMADMLRVFKLVPDLYGAATVHLVETSPVLRRRQARTLAEADPAVAPVWHDTTADLPPGATLVVANEFFDALPIRQFQRTGAGWRERLVAWDGDADGLRFVLAGQADMASALIPPRIAAAPTGAIAEVCPAALSLAADLGQRVAADGGAALIIDYGHPVSAPGDSFQAVRRHRPIDPLAAPGETDLTAHVDFDALGRAARAAGCAVHGPAPQGAWLEALGIRARADALSRCATPSQAAAIEAALTRLTAPEAMGTLFQVMALTPATMPASAGF